MMMLVQHIDTRRHIVSFECIYTQRQARLRFQSPTWDMQHPQSQFRVYLMNDQRETVTWRMFPSLTFNETDTGVGSRIIELAANLPTGGDDGRT